MKMKHSGVFKYKSAEAKEKDSWVAIGKVLRTVGLDGWVRVSILTDFPERFQPGAELHFQKKYGSPEPCKIEDVRDHFSGTMYEVAFEGYEDRDAVSQLTGAYLVIPKSERAELDDESFYPEEMEGLKVLSPEGKQVGKVLKFESEAPSPYLIVDSPEFGEVLIPFRKVFFSEISKKKAVLKLNHQLSTHVPAG